MAPCSLVLLIIFANCFHLHAAYYDESYPDFNLGYLETEYDTQAPRRNNLKISTHDLKNSVNFGKNVVDSLKRLEDSLGWSEIRIQNGTIEHGHFIENYPNVKALEQGKNAFITSHASAQLMNRYCKRFKLSAGECLKYISTYKLHETQLFTSCKSKTRICSNEEKYSKYRTIDGSCNHPTEAIKGQSNTNYKRLIYPNYLDGIKQIKRSVLKSNLPSARKVSSTLIKNANKPDEKYTLTLMEWTQFISHDMAHTVTSKMIHSNEKITCCTQNGDHLTPRYVHPFCMPITVPYDDDFYSKYNVECLSYVRSLPAIRSDCSFGPLEQLNQATHFLDGSHIYGADMKKSMDLRTYKGGQLKTSENARRTFLPLSKNHDHECFNFGVHSTCYKGADARINSQPLLTVMHTLWLREHNRIANELQNVNQYWSDEIVYQEARRIVIAEIQHITYNEWLPIVLGPEYVKKIYQHISDDYSKFIDPTISNSFAIAAIRFSKSLIDGQIRLINENRTTSSTLRLKDVFNNPLLIQTPGYFDHFVRTLSTQNSQKLDLNLPEDVTNHLFTNGKYGLDVASLDIQRGRDHGLPGYLAFRKLCGLPEINKFEDLILDIPSEIVNTLSETYKHPKDIDLLIGGLAEKPLGSSFLGPTFSCIVADQFLRTRHGDRYFYTHLNQPKSFPNGQLREIQKVTLAKIFCDNSDHVETMQKEVFKTIGKENIVVKCNDIPRENLNFWKESY